MPLDMFQQTQSDTDAYVAQHNAPRLPATFGDAFQAAWDENRMFGQSVSSQNAHVSALDDYLNDVQRRTGEPFSDLPADEASLSSPASLLPMINDRVAKLNAANPDLKLDPLTEEGLDQRAIAKSREARAGLADMSQREKTAGGSVGQFLGGAAGTATDPINLAVAPLAAPEGLGLLATAMAWAGIAGGTQAAIEATGAPYRDMVAPGYSQSGEPARNILGAAAGGAVLGGTLKGLGMAWTRAKTGEWPRSIRDAGNVTESEANVANSNVLPGLEGEVAHREALAKSIDDVVAGRKVDVPDAVTAPPLAPAAEAPGFDVFHGSPHDFERFDSSKIGTGEGTQAYGHGLYLAEHPDVAKSYTMLGENTVGGRPFDLNDPVHTASGLIDQYGTREKALDYVRKKAADDPYYGDVQRVLESQKNIPALETSGNMYQVRINADREHFLDWDTPINQQSDFIRSKLGDKPETGAQYHEQMTRGQKGSEIDFANAHANMGIPGIKYLDRGSRAGGEGTRNIVLFDDNLAQVTHKNGEPLSLFDQHEARVDMAMDERGAARAATPTTTEIAPRLPLEPTKPELHQATIADSVQSIAKMVGHDMPREEAERVAQMVVKASSDEQARAILSSVADRPQTVADYPPTPLTKSREGELPTAPEPKVVEQTVGSPEHDAALRADIDRARATGDVKIPAGVDEKGEPIFRSVDSAMDEVDAYKAAAEQIQACANPPAEPAEAA